MDPQAAWQDLLDAYADDDSERVEELADALLRWLDKGGFPPEVISGRSFGREWNETMARSACSFFLETIQHER